jgi:UPF0176 protein
MPLHNKIDSKVLKRQLQLLTEKRTTLSFYRYHFIEDTKTFRDTLYLELDKLKVWGRVYLASEGINAQLSVPSENLDDLKSYLYSILLLNEVRLNVAIEDDGKSFFKLKILIRKKIVADGLDDSTFDSSNCGVHLSAAEFNALADKPETIIVDMRNHYESEIGHFKNSIIPDVDTFREALPVVKELLKDKKDAPIIIYCTGGIRCEKASAYYKHVGFKNVFQLNGGIIEYARQVKKQGLENKFVGKNFVFDERLSEKVSDEVISVCHQCGTTCDAHTNCKNDGCHLLFIQCNDCKEKFNGCCCHECKEIIELPVEQQKEIRKGINKGRQVFKKGRSEKIHFKADFK